MKKKERLDSDEEYIAITLEAFPAGRDDEIVWNHSRQHYQVLQSALAEILRRADRFRTSGGHRQALLQSGWQDDGFGFIEDALAELIGLGLLRSKSDFLSTLVGATKAREDPARISTLGWVTRDRPFLLERSLDSFAANCRIYERQVDYKVFDDSTERQAQLSTRRKLGNLAREKSISISYAAEEEKRKFSDQLLKTAGSEGLPGEVLEFSLGDPFEIGFTAGGNYNAFLLGTAGVPAAVVDDDIVCKIAPPPIQASGLEICSCADPTLFRFYQDRDTLLKSVTDLECGILACHEQLLGRTVAGLLDGQISSAGLRCSRLSSSYLRLLETRSCKVAITMTGVYGDSGMGSPRMLLGLSGVNRETLMQSEDQYRSALISRELVRAVSCPTLGLGSFFMTMHSGFDNRLLLPPFFPVLRNCDGLFAHTLRICGPDSLIGYCPAALFHDPEERRVYSRDRAAAVEVRMTDLLILLTSEFQPRPGQRTMAENLQDLGRYLSQTASLRSAEFWDLIAGLWAGEMSRNMEGFNHLLAAYHGEPDYWAEDVEHLCQSILKRATSAGALVPDDLRDRLGEARAADACRDLVGAYGRLLTWWPLIVSTARTLRSSSEIELAVPV